MCIKIKREKVSILESEASKLAVLTTNPSVDESLQPPKIVPMPTQVNNIKNNYFRELWQYLKFTYRLKWNHLMKPAPQSCPLHPAI